MVLACRGRCCDRLRRLQRPRDLDGPAGRRERRPSLAETSFLADIAQNVAGDRLRGVVDAARGERSAQFRPHAAGRGQGGQGRRRRDQQPGVRAAGRQTHRRRRRRGSCWSSTPPPGWPGADADPHFWLDPISVITYVENIRAGLTAIDPAGAGAYAANAAAYRAATPRPRRLDRARVATIPASRRLLVTNHESFGHFADRYGFTVVGTILPSAETRGCAIGARRWRTLVDGIQATGAPAIFLETGSNPDLAGQVARETGVKVVTDLYTHSLGRGRSDVSRHDAVERGPHRRGALMSERIELREVTVCYGSRPALDSVTLSVDRRAPRWPSSAPTGPASRPSSRPWWVCYRSRPARCSCTGTPSVGVRDPVAYVPQREEVDWRFPVTVFDVVAMGRYGPGRWLKTPVAVGPSRRAHESRAAGHRRPGAPPHRRAVRRPAAAGLPGAGPGAGAARRCSSTSLSPGWTSRPAKRPSTCWPGCGRSGHGAGLDARSRSGRRPVRPGGPSEPAVSSPPEARQRCSPKRICTQAFGGQMVVVDGRMIVVDQCCGGRRQRSGGSGDDHLAHRALHLRLHAEGA